MKRDCGLDTLLDLNGTEFTNEDGSWYKIEVWEVEPSEERPHGIRYNLTLHNRYNKRIMGFDNAHSVKARKAGKYSGRIIEFDHVHTHPLDKGTHYKFESAEQLLKDFFDRMAVILGKDL